MTAVDALQATLAAEHAAVYLYGVLGGRTSQSAAPALFTVLRDAYVTHRSQRDQISRTIHDLGEVPVAAEVAYETPRGLTSPGAIEVEAASIEGRCTATYAALVAETVGDQRRWAMGALTAGAVRLVDLGAPPAVFPGAADLGA